MIEVISAKDKQKWDCIVSNMFEYDFYHLSTYHLLDNTGDAFLIYFENENSSFAYPFILRKIDNTCYYDVTSVYGYGGPLSSDECPSLSDIALFQQEIKQYFDENNIITAFSSLHPLFPNQPLLFSNFGDVANVNLTIAIDLKLSEIEQISQYARSTKYNINRLKRYGVSIKIASSEDEIDAFIKIYKENMDRVGATSKYYFSKEYFYKILKEIDSYVVLAIYKNEIIAGSLCTFCNQIMQAHLNATRNDFLFLSPLKLIFDYARKEGNKRNLHWFHLGGGRSGQNDSLFDFKSRFSHEKFIFKAWKYVHNEVIYNSLLSEKGHGNILDPSYFPLYRK